MSQPDPVEPVITEEHSVPRAVDTVTCPDCRGTGGDMCPECGGSGTITVEMPERVDPDRERIDAEHDFYPLERED